MEQRTYHGKITPKDFTRELVAHFHRGNMQVQQVGDGEKIVVQIATRSQISSGGQTAIGVSLQKVEDGVMVQIGKQAWLGIAASLGFTAIAALRNPLSLLNRIDDLAQDIESLSLNEEIWGVVEKTAQHLGAGFELSERLKRYVCNYCDTPNPGGESSCIACGAPLGAIQPKTCRFCGYVVNRDEKYCPNCGKGNY
ncbi:MAG: hypothetical protein CVU39_02720 [Chloroflexi bacterium HGW-Chloroflexi-10]|nr:MAG: hypothetical protein CVU39_02720 [Chloroflexi bacterium HGW-Chloroflexi-10]